MRLRTNTEKMCRHWLNVKAEPVFEPWTYELALTRCQRFALLSHDELLKVMLNEENVKFTHVKTKLYLLDFSNSF